MMVDIDFLAPSGEMMPEMRSKPTRIHVDLQGYKEPWLEWCRNQGVTPSEAMRQIAAKLTGQVPIAVSAEKSSATSGLEEHVGAVRKNVTLTEGEARAIEALAAQDGFSVPRWIVALIRVRLGRGAQFGQTELEALARSNMQLLAIGRNLNQMAKALNAQGGDRKLYRLDLVEALHEQIREHTKIVADAMSANIERWKGK
jgi:hypothetical protein